MSKSLLNHTLPALHIPLSLIKTNESFDAGNPVGGMEPVNNSYCIIKFLKEKRATNLLF